MVEVSVTVDDAYDLMVDELEEELGEKITRQQLAKVLQDGIREMYDNREQLKQQIQQQT